MTKINKVFVYIILLLSLIIVVELLFICIDKYKDYNVNKKDGKIIAYPINYTIFKDGYKLNYCDGYIDSYGRMIDIPTLCDKYRFKNPFLINNFNTDEYIVASKELEYQSQDFIPKSLKEEIENYYRGKIYTFYSKDKLVVVCIPDRTPKCGLVTLNGTPQALGYNLYDSISPINHNISFVCKDEKCGVIDNKGNIIINLDYKVNNIGTNYNDYGMFYDGYGNDTIFLGGYYFNLKGKKLFNEQYDLNSQPFKDGLAYVYVTENPLIQKSKIIKEGYINKKGKWIWSKKSTKKETLVYD